MGTAVEQRPDTTLDALVHEGEEAACEWDEDGECAKPVTHRFVLTCEHGGLICEYHAERCRAIDAMFRRATCTDCDQLVGLKSLYPI